MLLLFDVLALAISLERSGYDQPVSK